MVLERKFMKENIGKYLENNFWPKIPKKRTDLDKNRFVIELTGNKKSSYLKKLEHEFYQLNITRKGIVAANFIAFVNGWDLLPLLFTGSVVYLYFQAKSIHKTPEKLFNKFGGILPYKQKEEKVIKRNFDYDPTKISINDLQLGFLVDYNLKTYQVIEHYQYSSSNNLDEEKIILLSGIDEIVLYKHFNETNLKARVVEKVNIYSINDSLDTEILLKQKPMSVLNFRGKPFYRDSSSTGSYYSYKENKVIDRFNKWDYYDDSREEILCIEQKGSKTFEAYYGKIVHETRFSDILPKK